MDIEAKVDYEAKKTEYVELYREMLQKLSIEEAVQVGAEAMFHLQVLVGTRNSFERKVEDGEVVISRTKNVEDMQHEAYQFHKNHQP